MDQIQQLLNTFDVSWPSFLASLINFVILLIILHWFAYKPLLKMLEERRQRIADSMKQADQIKEELAKTQAAREEILIKANEAAQKMINEARNAAEKFRDQKLNEALQSAQETLRKAEVASHQEREKILSELRQEMVSLVIATTSKVAGKVLTETDQKRLADETLKELAV